MMTPTFSGDYPCGCSYTMFDDENNHRCCFHYVNPKCKLDAEKIGKIIANKDGKPVYRYLEGAGYDE